MRYEFRLWVANGDKRIFGEGPLELLLKVEQLGSLRQAALSMNMSYSKAFRIVKTLERELGFPVLERRIGGAEGGGSTITKEAQAFMEQYGLVKAEMDTLLASKNKK